MEKYSINAIVEEFKNHKSCDYHPKFFVGALEQLEGREIGLDEDLSQLVDKHWDVLWKNIVEEKHVPDVVYFMIQFTERGDMWRVLKKNLRDKASKEELLALLDSDYPLNIKRELFSSILQATQDEGVLTKLVCLEWVYMSEALDFDYMDLLETKELTETVLYTMKKIFVKNIGCEWVKQTYNLSKSGLDHLNGSVNGFVREFNKYVSDRGYQHLKIDMNEVESMRGELPPVASNFPKLELYNETKVLMEAVGINEDMQDKMGLTPLFNHVSSFD